MNSKDDGELTQHFTNNSYGMLKAIAQNKTLREIDIHRDAVNSNYNSFMDLGRAIGINAKSGGSLETFNLERCAGS